MWATDGRVEKRSQEATRRECEMSDEAMELTGRTVLLCGRLLSIAVIALCFMFYDWKLALIVFLAMWASSMVSSGAILKRVAREKRSGNPEGSAR